MKKTTKTLIWKTNKGAMLKIRDGDLNDIKEVHAMVNELAAFEKNPNAVNIETESFFCLFVALT